MKRNFVYLIKVIILLIILSFLSGFGRCQKIASVDLILSGPTQIAFWHYYGDKQEQALNELLNTFSQTLGKEKQIQVVAQRKGNIADLAEMLITAAISGDNMPDLFSVYPDSAWELADHGRLLPLNSLLDESYLAAFPGEFIREGKIMGDQDIYILPLAKASEVVALNQDAWAAFTTDYPRFGDQREVFSRWESIAAAATAYNRWSEGRAMFALDSLANYMVISNKQLGTDILARNGQDGKINLERETLYRLWQIYYPGVVTGSFSCSKDFVSDQMAKGNIIAGVVSTSAGPYLPVRAEYRGSKQLEPINLTVLPYPVFAEAEPVCVQQGAGLAVARSDSDRQKAAVILLQWLIRPEQNVSFAISSGYLPVTRPALQSQALQEYLERIREAEPDKPGIHLALSVFLDQMSSHELYASPAFAGSFQAREAISDSMYCFASQKRNQYLQELETGRHPDTLFDQYVNDAVFEEWYSRLLLDIDRIRRGGN